MSTVPPVPAPQPGPQPSAVQAHLRRAAQSTQSPWLHREIAQRMAGRLSVVLAKPVRVIDWWAALGGGGGALRTQYPRAHIEAVEPTDALLQRSRRAARAPWWSPRRWRAASSSAWREDALPREAPAQLLWANMMLHWSADPAATFAHWHEALAVDGFVMFSCFGPDTLRELRALYRRLGEPPPAHAFIDMHDLGDAMVHAGFADPVMDMERLTLTWADAPSALAELRTLGGNASAQRQAGLRTPRWLARLHESLASELTGPDERLHLTFEIVYGHAFKPVPRVRVAAQTRISLDTLRTMARSGTQGAADARAS
ncbi:MAG: biotin synthase [Methylibium sp.]|nr:biotin synthase [Methylibium sp.]